MRKRKVRDESRTGISGLLLILLIVGSMVGLVYLFFVVYIVPPKAPATQKASFKTVTTACTFDTDKDSATKGNRDFPEGDYTDMGAGTFYVSTQSGTSEDGSIPFILIDADTAITQIGYGSTEMDGSKTTYLYIDGMLNAKEQLSNSQGALDLKGDLLKAGTYEVEAVQFDNDEPTGNIITYKTASYEVKN